MALTPFNPHSHKQCDLRFFQRRRIHHQLRSWTPGIMDPARVHAHHPTIKRPTPRFLPHLPARMTQTCRPPEKTSNTARPTSCLHVRQGSTMKRGHRSSANTGGTDNQFPQEANSGGFRAGTYNAFSAVNRPDCELLVQRPSEWHSVSLICIGAPREFSSFAPVRHPARQPQLSFGPDPAQ